MASRPPGTSPPAAGSPSPAARPDGAARPPRLVELVRRAIRLRHYSRRTETAYVRWVVRYARFHGLRHPRELGAREIEAFLADLAVRGRVSAST